MAIVFVAQNVLPLCLVCQSILCHGSEGGEVGGVKIRMYSLTSGRTIESILRNLVSTVCHVAPQESSILFTKLQRRHF